MGYRTRTPDLRDDRGQVLVLVSAALFTLLMVVGMVIDVGIILEQKRQLQNAVDAAALAGARAVVDNPALAQAAAEQYLLLNGFDPADASLTISIDPNCSADEVEVTVVAVIPTAFFTIAGIDSKTVTVRAVGEARPVSGSSDYAFVALSETACIAFEKSGNSDLVINGGAIITNSACAPDALWAHGSGSIDALAANYYYEGEARVSGHVLLSPEPSSVSDRIEDPLAGLTVPSPATSPDSGGTSDSPSLLRVTSASTLSPGVYWGGIAITSDVVLTPGVYVMAGGGLTTAGGGSIQGDGILIYNTDNPGIEACDSMVLTGSNNVALTPMTSGEYAYVSLWQDKDCAETFRFSGGHSLAAGVIYVPGAHFDLNGGGTLGSVQVFADTISVSGNSDITMDFTGYVGDTGTPNMVLSE